MSHFLHRPWRRGAGRPPLVTYVDDLWVGCKPGEDAAGLYRELAACIRAAGMKPKLGAEKAIVDLREQSVTWLGYRLRLLRGELVIRSAYFAPTSAERRQQKHQRLVDKFARLHERPAGWRDVNAVVRGIVADLAPTLPYEDPQRIYQWIAAAAAEAGFQELWSFDEVLEHWQSAHDRWMLKLNEPGESRHDERIAVRFMKRMTEKTLGLVHRINDREIESVASMHAIPTDTSRKPMSPDSNQPPYIRQLVADDRCYLFEVSKVGDGRRCLCISEIHSTCTEDRRQQVVVLQEHLPDFLEKFQRATKQLNQKPKPYSRQKIREQHPRAYMPWELEEDEELADRYHRGSDVQELARILQRQPSAIVARLRRLGLWDE